MLLAFFSFFKKNKPILVRCTHCYDEFELTIREVRLLKEQNKSDSICPIKEECHICHIGYVIPVKYTDKDGKEYNYSEIKPKIKNLDPDTVMERIFGL